MPAILEAVESNATVGEIAASMGKVFGEYRACEKLRTESFVREPGDCRIPRLRSG